MHYSASRQSAYYELCIAPFQENLENNDFYFRFEMLKKLPNCYPFTN